SSPAQGFTVGNAGGTFESAGVEVTIPPGALSSDRTIVVTKTEEQAPADTTALSPIYHFEPDGLTFAIPIAVRLPLQGDGASAVVSWSSAGGDGFAEAPTRVDGLVAEAQVVHFSRGFAGLKQRPPPGTVDAAPGPDASVPQPSDAGASDAITDTTVQDGA